MRKGVLLAAAMALASPIAAQEDKAHEVMQQMRAALGGAALDRVQAIVVEGPFQREMGNRRVGGSLELTLQLPSSMHRLETTELMGGMAIERRSALKGDTAWDDIQNRGGMGGGMLVMREGPPGRELNAAQIEEARLRRLRAEMRRYLLAFLGGATLSPTYVAVAEAPEGRADVIEVADERGGAIRLFVSQQTHLPLMLQYREVRPRINTLVDGPRRGAAERRGGAQGERRAPDPEEIRKRLENMPPPEPVTVTLYLADFTRVDGVLFPRRITQSIEGAPVEEWTIERIRVNPEIKPDLFERK
jgi:hypothetical protein